ncbi:MAG: hypothetical protein ABIG68_08910 [Acidobacteriota bacterium]
MVQLTADHLRGVSLRGDHAQEGLEVRHQDGGRNPLAADVRNGQDEPAVGQAECVVVVPADAAGRQADGREIQAAIAGHLSGKQRLLDFQGKVQLRLPQGQFLAAGMQRDPDAIQCHPQDGDDGRSAERQTRGEYDRIGDHVAPDRQQRKCDQQKADQVDCVAVCHGKSDSVTSRSRVRIPSFGAPCEAGPEKPWNSD